MSRVSTTDRILELLDNALETTPEWDADDDSMGRLLEEGQCWRCMRNATPEGTTCAGCLAYMDGSSDVDPRSPARLPLPPGTGLVAGPGFFVSEHLIVFGGHRIVDRDIISRAMTIEHEPDGWMRVCVDLGRALREAMGHLERFVVRWGSHTIGASVVDDLFPVVPLRRREIRYERHGLRLTANPEAHPEHLDPLVDDVMGRGPLDDPVLPTDEWSGWMAGEFAVPPWMPQPTSELLADEVRDACAFAVGPPAALPVGVLSASCPTHGVELRSGRCPRCGRS